MRGEGRERRERTESRKAKEREERGERREEGGGRREERGVRRVEELVYLLVLAEAREERFREALDSLMLVRTRASSSASECFTFRER